jgi:CRP-like cAMP-binding protein
MGSLRIEQGKLHDSFKTRLRVAAQPLQPSTFVENTTLRGIEKAPLTTFNDLIKKLPGGVLRKLEPHIKKVLFASGEYLYRPDEMIDYLYFPETAVISELQILEDGRTIEVSITGHEGAIGLSSIYYPGRAINWVQVCGGGSALKISREALKRETRNLDWVNLIFHEYIQTYIRQISQKVACNAHHSVEERFCSWLLMLEDRSPRERLKLTQEHIARVLGVYRPSVTCIAQELRDLKLIDYVRGNIVILDREKLKKHSCSCYAELNTFTPNLRVIGEANGQKEHYVA